MHKPPRPLAVAALLLLVPPLLLATAAAAAAGGGGRARQFPPRAAAALKENSPRETGSDFDECSHRSRWMREANFVHHGRAALAQFSLECHGISVVDETEEDGGGGGGRSHRWDSARVVATLDALKETYSDASARKLQSAVGGEAPAEITARNERERAEREAALRPKQSIYEMAKQQLREEEEEEEARARGSCPKKMHIWQHVKAMLLEKLPKCWRKKGYTSISEGYAGACERHATEALCTGGCQWNPIQDIWLLHEAKFEKYGSPFKRLLTGNLWQHDGDKTMIDGHAVVYRRGGLNREEMREILSSYDGYKGEAQWLRRELKMEGGQRDDQVRSAFLNKHFQEDPERCGSHAHTGGFPEIHNDLIIPGMKHLYDWASGKPGEPSRRIRKRWKSATVSGAAAAAKAPGAAGALGAAANAPEPPPRYFVEMGNYWTPLDPYPLAINPLGWRVDTDDGLPWSNGGRVDVQAAPQMCAKKKGTGMNLAYGSLDKQGLLFLTRYLQHSALPLMDVQALFGNPEKNCRHSIEFRFMLVGAHPREVHSAPLQTYRGSTEDFRDDVSVPHCMTGERPRGWNMLREQIRPGTGDAPPTAGDAGGTSSALAAATEAGNAPAAAVLTPAEIKRDERIADNHGSGSVKHVDRCFGVRPPGKNKKLPGTAPS